MFMKKEIILAVLDDVRKELDLSKEFVELDATSPYFEDSCKVVDARHKLVRLYEALKLTSEYEH